MAVSRGYPSSVTEIEARNPAARSVRTAGVGGRAPPGERGPEWGEIWLRAKVTLRRHRIPNQL